jgi:uncharacterized sulfatase
LVIVTADNGMPFLRAKATGYEYGLHVPLAISWPGHIPAARKVKDPVGFVDLTATILAAAGITHPSLSDPALAPAGRNLLPILSTIKQGIIDPDRAFAFAGHERHTLTRYNDIGYPIRVLRTPQYLYIRNLRPERWPVGDPQQYDRPGGRLLPMWARCCRDVDDLVTLYWLRDRRTTPPYSTLFDRIVARHPAEELYDIQKDPDCLNNLVSSPQHAVAMRTLANRLTIFLRETNDPRLFGSNPDIADTYLHYNPNNPMGSGLYPPPPSIESYPDLEGMDWDDEVSSLQNRMMAADGNL